MPQSTIPTNPMPSRCAATSTPNNTEYLYEQDLDGEVARALACPCVADLRDGPCGASFVQAFTCFLKTKAEDKGTVCYEPYNEMQACMMKHPEAFADFVKDKTESELEQDAESEEPNDASPS